MKFTLATTLALATCTATVTAKRTSSTHPKTFAQDLTETDRKDIDAYLNSHKIPRHVKAKRKEQRKRELRMGKKKKSSKSAEESPVDECATAGKSGKGKSGNVINNIRSAALRYVDGVYIAPAGCLEECLQNQADMTGPLTIPCNTMDPNQVWNILPVAGTSLPLFQVQSEASGLCVGVTICEDAELIMMYPCSDPRTQWFTPTGEVIQSYFCYDMQMQPELNGHGIYWSVGGQRPLCEDATTVNTDDITFGGSAAYFFTKCQVEEF